MRVKSLALLFVFSILASLLTVDSVSAANFDYRISSFYTVNGDDKASVRTIIDVTNNTTSRTPTRIVLPVAGDASDIEAAYQDGGNITANFTPENNTISLETTKSKAGRNNKWSVVVNYDVDVVTSFGETKIISIPANDYGELSVKAETVSVATDLALGLAVARGPEPNNSRIVAGQQVLTWKNNKSSLSSSVGVLFGDAAVADVRIEKLLKNEGWWWKDVTLTLPPDTNQQQVFLREVTPAPSSVSLDVDGNILLSYRLRPQQTISVNARVDVAVRNLTYAIEGQTSLTEVPPSITELYTAAVGPWQNSELSQDIDQDMSIDVIEAIYKQVSSNEVDSDNSYEAAKQLSNTLIGELRSAGVPARLVLGKAFGDGAVVLDEAVPHAWVEAYAAGVGWMTLDPYFEQSGDYFGVTDTIRVAMVLRGVDPDFPPEQLEETSINYTENDLPELPVMTPTLSATNYVVLPGLAVQSVSASLPEGVIVDGNGIKVGDKQPQSLGSLAPLQTVTLRTFAFGGQSFSSQEVQYGFLLDGNIVEVVAQTQVQTSYIPLLVIIFLISAFFVGRHIYRKRSSHVQKDKPSRDAVQFGSEDAGDHIESQDLIPNVPVHQAPPQTAPSQQQAPEVETSQPRGDTMSPRRSPSSERPRRRRRIQ